MPMVLRRNNVLSTRQSKNGNPKLLIFNLNLKTHRKKPEATPLSCSDAKLNMRNLRIQLRH
jgi:hypothetical protein